MTGPEPQSGAWAFVYNNATEDQFVNGCGSTLSTAVIFNNASIPVTQGILFDGTDALLLPETGTYKALFSVRATANLQRFSWKLLQSSGGGPFTDIPGSIRYRENFFPSLLRTETVEGEVLFLATAGDVVQLANNVTTGVTLAAAGLTAPGVSLESIASASTNNSDFVQFFMPVSQGSSLYVAVQSSTSAPLVCADDQDGIYTPFGPVSIGGTLSAWLFIRDNVNASGGLGIVAFTDDSTNATLLMEVAVFSNTANPSFDSGSLQTHSGETSAFCLIFPGTEAGQVGFASLGVPGNGTTFAIVPPGTPLSYQTDGPPFISGGDAMQDFTGPSDSMCFTLANVPVVALGIPILPFLAGDFCSVPANASLVVNLLR